MRQVGRAHDHVLGVCGVVYDEGAYRALQSFLAAYDDSVTRLASNR